MSLKVWLPLNGTLENKGVSNINIVNENATINTAGKIGSCYAFNGDGYRIHLSGDDLFKCIKGGSQPFSIAMWVFHEDSRRAILFGDYNSTGAINVNIELTTGHIVRFYWNGNPDYNTGVNIGASAWSHLTITYDGNKLCTYLNGALAATNNITLSEKNKTSGEFFLGRDYRTSETALKGRLNDFRVYDHCLSAAEVHEISQGLVLHYKLDDIPQNYSKNNNTAWTNFTLEQYYSTIFSYSMADFQAATGAKNGDKFTWSLDLKATGGTKHIAARVQHYNTSSDRNSVIGNYIQPNQEGRSSITFTVNTAYNQLDFLVQNGNSSSVTNNTTEQYKNTKIQAGDVSTEWIPTGMSQTITDSSGYGHNGTVTGTLTLSSDTPRYSASSKFIAGSKVSGTGFLTTQSPVFTLSYWLHIDGGTYTKWADIISFTGSATFRQETSNTSGTSLRWYNYPIGTSDGTGGTTMTVGAWTHLAFSSDGTKFYFYKNGVLYSTITMSGTAWTPNGNFTIGDSNNMFMSMSDFRIYCTALSAADVKQLYEVGAKIDNKGNLHTYEINEHGQNKLKKTGVFYNYASEPYIQLSDGSCWKLILFHYVDNGTNLFTSSNATYNDGFGLYSRLRDIDNFTYDGKYEFYVIQDGTEFRWTQTSKPTATSIAGKTVVSGYNDPVNGLAKPSSLSQTYIGYNSWWGACGCWTQYSTGGKTGIPGFGAHGAAGMCTKYLALYARIDEITYRTASNNHYANNLIEI